jgi:carbon storage regulator CsrA
MLILTRRIGDSVVIKHPTGDIVVTYLSTQGPTGTEIRMGFDAPRDVNIVRSEILDRYPDDHKGEK